MKSFNTVISYMISTSISAHFVFILLQSMYGPDDDDEDDDDDDDDEDEDDDDDNYPARR